MSWRERMHSKVQQSSLGLEEDLIIIEKEGELSVINLAGEMFQIVDGICSCNFSRIRKCACIHRVTVQKKSLGEPRDTRKKRIVTTSINMPLYGHVRMINGNDYDL